MTKLHEVIAIEKGIRNRNQAKIDELYKVVQKEDLFTGYTRVYTPRNEGDETFDTEVKTVQTFASAITSAFREFETEIIDIEAKKNVANTLAKADIEVNGKILALDVPVTTLLFLEKQVSHIKAMIEKIPVLDPSKEWKADLNSPLHIAALVTTYKQKKIQKSLVLAQATDKFPAQAQLITEDETVGQWSKLETSGAMTANRKMDLWKRTNALLDAVKQARERANSTEVASVNLGESLLSFVFD
jgi:hypothetical protein